MCGYTSYIADLDEDLCIDCENCVDRCPIEAPFIEENIAKVNKDRFFRCFISAQSYPQNAINLSRTGLREVFILAPKIN